MKKTYIFGDNSIARMLQLFLEEEGRPCGGLVLNKAYIPEKNELSLLALEDVLASVGPKDLTLYVVTGYSRLNRNRQKITEALLNQGIEIGTYIHPSSAVSRHAALGPGTIVLENCVIQPFSTIGTGNIVQSGTVIAHNCTMGDYNYLSVGTNICGGVTIGSRCFFGAGCTIQNKRVIGSDVIIGAGSYLNKNMKDGKVYAGNKGSILPVSSEEMADLI